ncbi:hypothetical protein [Flexivirga sp. B27]
MPSRSVRTAAALALATSATTFAYVGSAAPAHAEAYNGYCKTSSGVTVVVDFRGLGGGVAIRCSPVGSGASGLDALQAAGIPVEGTRDVGLSVACRIYGKPTATQELPGGYHESCARMPPTKAFWSYWQAPNGGSWSFSQKGLSTSQVIPGGFEGWSFSEGSTVAPGKAPTRPSEPTSPPATTTTQPPRHTTTTAPKHDPAPGTSTSTAGDAGGGSEAKSTASGKAAESKAAKSAAAKGKAGKSKAAASKAAAKSKAAKSKKAKASHSSSSSSSKSASSSAGAATGASSGAGTNAAGGPVANSDDLIKDSKKDSSGINATTVVGGGVLGALAIGGGVVAIIRKRNLG